MKLRHDIAALLPRIADAEMLKFCLWYEKYAPHLPAIATNLYDRLNHADQARFLLWFLKRWASIDLVNPVERALYDATLERLRSEPRVRETLENRPYMLRDFASQGHSFKLLGYQWFLGVHDILYNQYEHGNVVLAPDDVIIDAGAFIGDTAVLFHHKLKGRCKIHSFELLDENLVLYVHNLDRNGIREDQVVLNKLALTDTTGDEIVMDRDARQCSSTMFGSSANGDRIQTVTLDDYVVASQLDRVDYIKMDIEGAEVAALNGARHTIRHFQPRLAICLYHKWDDVMTIPAAILDAGVDYRFEFKWVQLKDGLEAVLHASPMPVHEWQPAVAADEGTHDHLADALASLASAYARKSAQADMMLHSLREMKRSGATTATLPV